MQPRRGYAALPRVCSVAGGMRRPGYAALPRVCSVAGVCDVTEVCDVTGVRSAAGAGPRSGVFQPPLLQAAASRRSRPVSTTCRRQPHLSGPAAIPRRPLPFAPAACNCPPCNRHLRPPATAVRRPASRRFTSLPALARDRRSPPGLSREKRPAGSADRTPQQ